MIFLRQQEIKALLIEERGRARSRISSSEDKIFYFTKIREKPAHSLCKTPKTPIFLKAYSVNKCYSTFMLSAVHTHIHPTNWWLLRGVMSWVGGKGLARSLGCYSAAAVWPGLCISKHRRHASPSLKFWPRFNQAAAEAPQKFTCNSLFQPKSHGARAETQLSAGGIFNFHPAMECHVNTEK